MSNRSMRSRVDFYSVGMNHQDVIRQGYNARKVISEEYASFVLSLGGNVNTRRMSNPDMGSIFT